METRHRFLTGDSRSLDSIPGESVHLVVTSPPYPMIEMWDDMFSTEDEELSGLLDAGKGTAAFDRMHASLDRVWSECFRLLVPGGFACINIGDAVRTLAGRFRLFSNHARIIKACEDMGFQSLPLVLWRKQTNAPNKFMGSGMLPAGAYVTLEHEYILIFRKGGKREFRSDLQKELRRRSALFWEERNNWFSDLWDFKGVRQTINGVEKKARERSAAFPFELAYRLVHMYSLQGDTVLDPFSGTGTTSLAAAAGARNSIGVDLLSGMQVIAAGRTAESKEYLNAYTMGRLEGHLRFALERREKMGEFKYQNVHYNFPVVTGQERELLLPLIGNISSVSGSAQGVEAAHKPEPAQNQEIPKDLGPAQNPRPAHSVELIVEHELRAPETWKVRPGETAETPVFRRQDELPWS